MKIFNEYFQVTHFYFIHILSLFIAFFWRFYMTSKSCFQIKLFFMDVLLFLRTGEHPYQSVISIKLLCNFIKIALRHGCSPVYLLHIFRTPFLKKTSGRLLLKLPLLGYEWQTYSGSNISILCVRVCFSANSLEILIVGI